MVLLKNTSVGLSCGFPFGAGFLLHLERETAHDRPTNRQFRGMTVDTFKEILRFCVVSSHDGGRFSPYHDEDTNAIFSLFPQQLSKAQVRQSNFVIIF